MFQNMPIVDLKLNKMHLYKYFEQLLKLKI